MTAEVMTYSKLNADVLSYCERSDAAMIAQIPRLIMLAENRLASEVRGLGFLRVSTGNMEAGNPIIAKPENWRESSSFRVLIGSRYYDVYKRTYEFCRKFAPDYGSKGIPRYYADYDFEHFLVAKSPLIGYNFELIYFEKPVPLSSDNETNWVTVNAPQLILYATLLEAQAYLKNDGRITTFKDLYVQASQAVLEESRRREIDRSSGAPA